MSKRTLTLIAGIVLLAVSEVLDPYTWFLNASDMVVQAPVWQTLIGLLDVALFLGAAVLLWRKQPDRAMALLLAEFSINVAKNLVYLERDGLSRFARGFGGEEYLSLYLFLLLVRAWILVGTHVTAYSDSGKGRT